MEQYKFDQLDVTPRCLKDQVILITGASDGIGKALALQAAKAGATTILLGKSVKKLEALYDEMMEKGYPEPALHPINFVTTHAEAIYELVAHVQTMFGKLNALVHNASDYGQLTPLEHLPAHQWDLVMKVNLTVPFLLTNAFLPLLKLSTPANILFTLANEAFKGKAYWSAYSASKFGLRGLAQSLYEECENIPGLRINCINPISVRTTSRMKAYPGIDPERFQPIDDIMPYYLQVLSQSTINGKVIETTTPERVLA